MAKKSKPKGVQPPTVDEQANVYRALCQSVIVAGDVLKALGNLAMATQKVAYLADARDQAAETAAMLGRVISAAAEAKDPTD